MKEGNGKWGKEWWRGDQYTEGAGGGSLASKRVCSNILTGVSGGGQKENNQVLRWKVCWVGGSTLASLGGGPWAGTGGGKDWEGKRKRATESTLRPQDLWWKILRKMGTEEEKKVRIWGKKPISKRSLINEEVENFPQRKKSTLKKKKEEVAKCKKK